MPEPHASALCCMELEHQLKHTFSITLQKQPFCLNYPTAFGPLTVTNPNNCALHRVDAGSNRDQPIQDRAKHMNWESKNEQHPLTGKCLGDDAWRPTPGCQDILPERLGPAHNDSTGPTGVPGLLSGLEDDFLLSWEIAPRRLARHANNGVACLLVTGLQASFSKILRIRYEFNEI